MWGRKMEINKVLENYIRQLLGVGKKTSTKGRLIECGKYPLCMKVFIHIIRYWISLKS